MPGELQNAQIAIELLVTLRGQLNENLEAVNIQAPGEQIDITLKNYEMMLRLHSHLVALITAAENSAEFKNLPDNSPEKETLEGLKKMLPH